MSDPHLLPRGRHLRCQRINRSATSAAHDAPPSEVSMKTTHAPSSLAGCSCCGRRLFVRAVVVGPRTRRRRRRGDRTVMPRSGRRRAAAPLAAWLAAVAAVARAAPSVTAAAAWLAPAVAARRAWASMARRLADPVAAARGRRPQYGRRRRWNIRWRCGAAGRAAPAAARAVPWRKRDPLHRPSGLRFQSVEYHADAGAGVRR